VSWLRAKGSAAYRGRASSSCSASRSRRRDPAAGSRRHRRAERRDQVSASAAADKAQSWLEDAGVDSAGASSANQNVSDGTSSTISTFVKGSELPFKA
jgi:hypothetical protein